MLTPGFYFGGCETDDYGIYLRQGINNDQINALFWLRRNLENDTSIGENKVNHFIYLVSTFLRSGGNPNLIFPRIFIGSDDYRDVTCFQLVYIYCKHPKLNLVLEQITRLESLIDYMLEDEKVDIRATFTEHYLKDRRHFYHSGKRWTSHHDDNYLLENMTIAHYAMAIRDFEMVDKVLRKAPDLLNTPCCLTTGKNLLSFTITEVKDVNAGNSYLEPENEGFSKALEKILDTKHDPVVGTIAWATFDYCPLDRVPCEVTRITKVSLLHLAARTGDEIACGYLRAEKADFTALDSEGHTPLAYLQTSISEGLVPTNPYSKRLCKVLEPIVRLNRPHLPQTNYILQREGYKLVYNTSTKIALYAYQRLTKASLQKVTDRKVGSFKADKEITALNRGELPDYKGSGRDRGHVVPAEDARSSIKSMQDTFLLSNVWPQEPSFNQGYWKHFEAKIRRLVNSYDVVEVFTGALFPSQQCADGKTRVCYETMGQGHVAVPNYFFKVIYLHTHTTIERAYIVPNQHIPKEIPFEHFLATVDRVQQISGVLFNEWRNSRLHRRFI